MRALLVAGCALLTAACGGDVADPRPQWNVELATDAQLPQFGDRVFVEVLAPGRCELCRRQLGLPGAEAWPISFGIVPPDALGTVAVRVRLFRTSTIGPEGVPLGSALIDALSVLPQPSGVTRVTMPLSMSCFSLLADPERSLSCNPLTGALGPAPTAPPAEDRLALVPGSWGPGQARDCTGTPPTGMVCVPGGAFLLGDARPNALAGGELTPAPERLVQISPFFLDRDEFTLGALERFFADHPEVVERPELPHPADLASRQCKYPLASSAPDLPVNCLSHELASRVCEALGKRLPTEAEWEYAAGQRGLETSYPWGEDEDVCARAVVGRAEVSGVTRCRATDTTTLPEGPQAGGSDRDLTLDGVRNLGGNLSEWVLDAFAAYDGACFAPERTLLEDPRCDAGSGATYALVARGGNFRDRPIFARVTRRYAQVTSRGDATIGFRCAKRAE